VELIRHHATAFLPSAAASQIESLRRKWDPDMEGQIPAHLTLVYPEEIADPDELQRITRWTCADTKPLIVSLGPTFYVGQPAVGVFFIIVDTDGSIERFRRRIVPESRAVDFPLHVTVVHLRTSDRGEAAWAELADTQVLGTFVIDEVAITAFDGARWRTVREYPLSGHVR
jgi:hypothetical protein